MSQNYYLNEKLAEAHRQELMHQAEQERLLAHMPGQRSRIAVQLGVFLSVLGTSLKQLGRLLMPEQASEARERMTMPKQIPTRPLPSVGSPHH